MRFAAWTPTGLFFLALEETTITADSKMAASKPAPDGSIPRWTSAQDFALRCSKNSIIGLNAKTTATNQNAT